MDSHQLTPADSDDAMASYAAVSSVTSHVQPTDDAVDFTTVADVSISSSAVRRVFFLFQIESNSYRRSQKSPVVSTC